MKKGLSPIITVILLIAITMTASALFYSWASNSVRDQNRNNEELAREAFGCSGGSIYFDEDDITFDQEINPTSLKVLVTNDGLISLFDFDFVVVSDTKNVYVLNPTSDTIVRETNPLDRGEVRLIEANIGDEEINGIDTIRIRAKQRAEPTIDCLISYDVILNA